MANEQPYQCKYFSERELACRHCGQSGCSDELKKALDEYREVVGMPVEVHDAYRCTAHNATVSLVKKSEHPLGAAADIRVPGLTLQEMYDAAKKVPAFFYGGIGVYDAQFIHVDIRDRQARWAFVAGKEQPALVLVMV